MERKSLDEIINNAQTGRAISPAGVINAAVDMMNTPIREMVNTNLTGDELDWAYDFAQYIELNEVTLPYSKVYEKVEMVQIIAYPYSNVFLYLAGMALGPGKQADRWLRVSIEDAMTEAGMEKEFDIWFKEDVRLWEKIHGKAPRIGKLMQIIFDAFAADAKEHEMVNPLVEKESELFPGCRVTEPFIRHEEDILFKNPPGSKKREVSFNERYTRLVCTWVWLLMLKAPMAILEKKCKKQC